MSADPEKQALLPPAGYNGSIAYAPPYPKQQEWAYPPNSVVYAQQPAAPTVVVVEERSRLQMVLFFVGWVVPITWWVGACCAPARGASEKTWRTVNRIITALSFVSLIVVAILAITGTIMIASSAGEVVESNRGMKTSKCLTTMNKRCYDCDNFEGPLKCTLTLDDKRVGRYQMSMDDANQWLVFGKRPSGI